MKNGLAHPAAMLWRRAALGVDQAGLVRDNDELYPVVLWTGGALLLGALVLKSRDA